MLKYTEKTKYMLTSRHQNADQNHNVQKANRSFANVENIKYLGTTITLQSAINEVKSTLLRDCVTIDRVWNWIY
jgi:hypothetical protein